MKIALLVVSIVIVGLAVAGGYKYSRAGYESAAYEVVSEDGQFEIRRYPDLALASTSMESASGQDGGFMRLFRYISGRNEAQREIAMTTPVFMKMDGPQPQMSFVLPRQISQRDAPRATGEDVRIEKRSGGLFAVYRFSGVWDPERFGGAREKLAQWVREKGLKSTGDYEVAGYDPPFTPPFLRRNEVLVRIAE